jgi:hypothetical protein
MCVTSNNAFEQIAAVNLSTVANIATALTVLTAVVFGLIEMRRARPAWITSMTLVQAISEGTTPAQIEAESASLSSGPIHSLHPGIAWVCRVCVDGSIERS